ncbi:50S ribosomal protein L13 [Patescibacteria group bacterium]|nr:50S ribosomal protein L13 [Patescibacteria group bacterium]
MERDTHAIDATGKSLGRLAVEIAVLLRGKHKPDFAAHKDGGDAVKIQNVQHMRVTGKKMAQKKYYRHSGFLGGLKEMPLEKLWERDPGEVLRRAVQGMLPATRLRKEQMKRLKIEQ